MCAICLRTYASGSLACVKVGLIEIECICRAVGRVLYLVLPTLLPFLHVTHALCMNDKRLCFVGGGKKKKSVELLETTLCSACVNQK